MRPIAALGGLILLLLALLVPATAAAQGPDRIDGRVLVSVNGDLELPAGDEAEVVVVVNGDALIAGTVEAVAVVNGTVTLDGATVGTLTIINGTAQIGAGSTVERDVVELNSTIATDPEATIEGEVRSLAVDLAGVGIAIGVLGVLAWIAFAIVTWAAGLALAAFGARQVRSAEWLISSDPGRVFLAGVGMLFLPPFVAVLLMVTVIGLPVGLALLLIVWPVLAFLGWLVAATWIGEWLLRTMGRPAPERRPYLGVTLGVVIAGLLSLIPVVGAIVSLFGMGAIALAGWRMLRQPEPGMAPPPGYVPMGR